jgi:hypothetical protein
VGYFDSALYKCSPKAELARGQSALLPCVCGKHEGGRTLLYSCQKRRVRFLDKESNEVA